MRNETLKKWCPQLSPMKNETLKKLKSWGPCVSRRGEVSGYNWDIVSLSFYLEKCQLKRRFLTFNDIWNNLLNQKLLDETAEKKISSDRMRLIQL
jgi:hypothetical protein